MATSNPKAPFQLNGYKIKWSKTYEKWQVYKGVRVIEEFKDKESARNFAKDN